MFLCFGHPNVWLFFPHACCHCFHDLTSSVSAELPWKRTTKQITWFDVLYYLLENRLMCLRCIWSPDLLLAWAFLWFYWISRNYFWLRFWFLRPTTDTTQWFTGPTGLCTYLFDPLLPLHLSSHSLLYSSSKSSCSELCELLCCMSWCFRLCLYVIRSLSNNLKGPQNMWLVSKTHTCFSFICTLKVWLGICKHLKCTRTLQTCDCADLKCDSSVQEKGLFFFIGV